MPAGGGTVYLGLSKVDGYTPPNQQVITKVTS